jgi:dTDP-4-dehydrorhamnose 3,5-epimerase
MSDPRVDSSLLRSAVRDPQTVTPKGVRVDDVIHGVRVRRAITHSDDRGTLCEMYDTRWDFTEEPLVYAYQLTIRPGQAKGWVVHLEQDDRMFFSAGTAKAVLYDAREDSPTHGLINELYFDAHNRGLLRIPKGVFHALANVGGDDVVAVNMPTRPYRHDDPDKLRLPLDTDEIPYRF